MEPQQKANPFILPLSIVLAGALVGAGIYLSSRETSVDVFGGNTAAVSEINLRPVNTDDHILGNPNAPVVIVEYSDTECPFCKTFHNTMHRLIDEYGRDGKLAWVYRHFPIDSLHTKARKEAEATECAATLGGNTKFWEYIDEVFLTTPSNDGLDLALLPQIAINVGLDKAKFESCLSSGQMAKAVQDDYTDAVSSGGRGTPHSVLLTRSGEKVTINGAQPYDVMKTLVDTALAQQGIEQN